MSRKIERAIVATCAILVVAFVFLIVVSALLAVGGAVYASEEETDDPIPSEWTTRDMPASGLFVAVSDGPERKITNALDSELYLNYKDGPEEVYDWSMYPDPPYLPGPGWDYVVRHTVVYTDLFSHMFPGNVCELELLWSDPIEQGVHPYEGAWRSWSYMRQQSGLCWRYQHTLWGVGGVDITTDEGYDWLYKHTENWILPDVWHLHGDSRDIVLEWPEIKSKVDTIEASGEIGITQFLEWREPRPAPIILSEVTCGGTILECTKSMYDLWALIRSDQRLHSVYWKSTDLVTYTKDGVFLTDLGKVFRSLQNMEKGIFLPILR